MMDPITLTIVGLAIAGASFGAAIGGPAIKARLKRRRSRKALYKTVLKKSSDLQPEEVMGELRGSHKGGFRDYYLPRDEIEEIRNRIAAGKDVLVIGDPLAGKSRAVYEALKNTENPSDVTIPRIVDVNPNEFKVNQYISGTRKGVLLVDDINKYVSKQHFEFLLQQYIDNGYLIVATCRKGPELGRAKSALEQIFASLFNDPVELGKIERGKAEAVARATGVDMPERYDGNIGSIFVALKTVEQRYAKECSDEGRAVLRSIKRLFMCGVYEEGGIYSETHIKKVCEELEELKLEKFKWKSIIDSLTDLSFLRPDKEGIAVDETYIEQVFKVDCSQLDNFRELAKLFSDDPEALYSMGARIDATEYSHDLKMDYTEIRRFAITVCLSILRHWSAPSHPEHFLEININLGIAYRKLGGLENHVANYRNAISAYQDALKVSTPKRFPVHFAIAQGNMGGAYAMLAQVEERSSNCKKAITAFRAALSTNVEDIFPRQCVVANLGLGSAYGILSRIENRKDNLELAVVSFQDGLEVATLTRFPTDFAHAKNNLGNILGDLAEMNQSAADFSRAIAAYEDALVVRTFNRHPEEYAQTQLNLGCTYSQLLELEYSVAICKSGAPGCVNENETDIASS